MRTLPHAIRAALVATLALAPLAACGRADARDAHRAAEDSLLRLDAPRTLSATTAVGAAPMFAVAPTGARAAAWVSAPGGGTDGRLYLVSGAATATGSTPGELRDALGPIEAHGEAPPKIAFLADGALGALYVVGKEIPDRRFPAGALRFARSTDGGHRWSAPVTVTDDSTFGSHNFHALHAAPSGAVYAAWLDGRAGRSAVFVTRSTDGGRHWGINRRVELGEACPCCRTALASGADGTMYVAWRKVFPGSVRDVVVARSRDGGATWSDPVRVHADGWVFEGCPHAGPAMQVDARGRVHVTWWTGKPGAAGVWYARSDDGARTFGAPVAIGVAPFSRPSHVQLALGARDRVVVAWDDGIRAPARVLARVSPDGGSRFAPPLAVSAPGRAASFPVLAVHGDRVSIAWSEQGAAEEAHAGHAMPDMKDPKARQRLAPVGARQVVLREGTLGG